MESNPLTMVEPVIFRAYDIRGPVPDCLNAQTAYWLGRAIGSEMQDCEETRVIVGRDGRLSSPELFTALVSGLKKSGVTVIDIDMVPTPLLYFSLHHLKIPNGVMLTASHNPSIYNGMKIVIGGETLAGDRIQALAQRITRHDFYFGEGKLYHESVMEAYCSAVVSNVSITRSLKVVIDCANGVTGLLAPNLLRALGCEVIGLYTEIDGEFPHHPPDPSVKDNLYDLSRLVQETGADVGFAFDGDGDRLGVVTEQGEVIEADRQLMLLAQSVLATYPGSAIVYDIKCSRHLTEIILQHGGKPVMSKTGHGFIKDQMQKERALLAGEMSGHIFWADRWFGFDDALYTAARLLELLAQSISPLSLLCAHLPSSHITPELKCALSESEKFGIVAYLKEHAVFHGEVLTIDGLRVEYPDGWGLLRASNTSANLVFRFEADNSLALQRIQEEFRQQVLRVSPNLVLPF